MRAPGILIQSARGKYFILTKLPDYYKIIVAMVQPGFNYYGFYIVGTIDNIIITILVPYRLVVPINNPSDDNDNTTNYT